MFCSFNITTSACEAPSVSSCASLCHVYKSENGCHSIQGCTWDAANPQCKSANSSPCVSANETGCTADSACFWETVPCVSVNTCQRVATSPGSCSWQSGMTDAECTSQPGCAMQPDCRQSTCHTKPQDNCTTTPGCFSYTTTTVNEAGVSSTRNVCQPCFNDPNNRENHYVNVLAHADQKCTEGSVYFSVYNVVAAPTGCTGGSAYPENDFRFCSPAAGRSASLLLLLAMFLA